MAKNKRPKSSRDKVRAYRERMRARGMRQISFWVPDVNSAEFKAEARRQSRLVATDSATLEAQAFLDSLFDDPEFQESLGGVPEYE